MDFMDLSLGDRVFYTRSNGMRVPATVVGMAGDGFIHLEYYQDALRVVNRQCKMESISFAIPSTSSPPHCTPPPPSAPQEAPSKSPEPSVPFVNRPFESEIHGTVNFTQFCCVLLVTWCYRVLLSCYLRPK